MRVLIAPYAARLRSGKPNPKNYPYWPQLITLLNDAGYEVVQVGTSGETRLPDISECYFDLTFTQIRDLVNDCATWLTVDSWLQHFCHCEQLKTGIVLWGQSDPRIFGYPENVNLLRGRDYLRPWPYDTWEAATYRADAFVYAENVMPHVYKLAPLPLHQQRQRVVSLCR